MTATLTGDNVFPVRAEKIKVPLDTRSRECLILMSKDFSKPSKLALREIKFAMTWLFQLLPLKFWIKSNNKFENLWFYCQDACTENLTFETKIFNLIFAESAFGQKQILCERIITSMTGNFKIQLWSIRVFGMDRFSWGGQIFVTILDCLTIWYLLKEN